MLLLGFISILQIIILPGIVVLRYLHINTNSKLENWLFVFTLSLFVNYFTVTVLTLFSIYTAFVFYGIIILELATSSIYLLRNVLTILIILASLISIKNLRVFLKVIPPFSRILYVIAASVVLFYIAVFVANIGTIFYFIDSVNNHAWNSWAGEFANNILPTHAGHYPQLLPANWSVCYLLIGKANIQYFPKLIMPLFFINILLIFLDLALTKQKISYLIALIIYGILSPIVLSLVFISDGNADLPVAFFTLMTFYLFIRYSPKVQNHLISIRKIDGENKDQVLKSYLSIFLFAAMAAATKMAGIYVFLLASIILLYFLLQLKNKISKADLIKIVLFVVLISLITLFWYVRSSEALSAGFNQRRYLPGDYIINAARAFKLIYVNWGLPVCLFLLVTVFTSLFDKKTRLITIIMVIIPLILWACKYSVDFRNLSFVLPFLSFSAATGFLKLFNMVKLNGSQEEGIEDAIKSIDSFMFSKKMKILFLSLIGSVLLLNLTLSNIFYLFLFNLYNFIHKYYFLGNRIIYFIEYDLQLHVDFYQRTYIALTLVIFLLLILVVAKIRLFTLLGLGLIFITLLNFTSLSGNKIIESQKASFEKVEARNYYSWIEMIMKVENNTSVYTNFSYIVKDSLPRDIKFEFIPEVSKSSLLNLKNSYIFLKSDFLDYQTKDFLKNKFAEGRYTLILDDSSYLLFLTKQG